MLREKESLCENCPRKNSEVFRAVNELELLCAQAKQEGMSAETQAALHHALAQAEANARLKMTQRIGECVGGPWQIVNVIANSREPVCGQFSGAIVIPFGEKTSYQLERPEL